MSFAASSLGFLILLIFVNGRFSSAAGYSDEIDNNLIDVPYQDSYEYNYEDNYEDDYENNYEDSYVSYQDHGHNNREKEKYSESRGRRKYVQQSGTNRWFDNILATGFNKIKY